MEGTIIIHAPLGSVQSSREHPALRCASPNLSSTHIAMAALNTVGKGHYVPCQETSRDNLLNVIAPRTSARA